MERNSQLTLAQILTRLSQVLAEKSSGTFFVATDINTSCRFAIADGKITHCVHKRDQGMIAVSSFLETGGGSCSFSENQFAPFREDALVKHQECMDLLGIRPVSRLERPLYVAPPPTSAPISAPSPVVVAPAKVNNRFYRGGFAAG